MTLINMYIFVDSFNRKEVLKFKFQIFLKITNNHDHILCDQQITFGTL